MIQRGQLVECTGSDWVDRDGRCFYGPASKEICLVLDVKLSLDVGVALLIDGYSGASYSARAFTEIEALELEVAR